MNIEPKLPTLNDKPIFYVYRDKNGWKRTDENLTSILNKAVAYNRWDSVETCGYSFYPQWRKPDNLEERKVAWRITADKQKVARYDWCIREHNAKHNQCHLLKDGTCAIRRLVKLKYDVSKKLWIIDEQPRANKPTSDMLDRQKRRL